MAAKKKPGRRLRQPSRKKGRAQLNVLVGDELMDRLLEEAGKSGRALSTEAVFQIESGIKFNHLVTFMRTTYDQIFAGNIDETLRECTDLVLVRDLKTGLKAWCEPGHPFTVPSEFVDVETFETEAHLEQSAAVKEVVGITDEAIERQNQQKLESADLKPNFDIYEALDRLDEVEEIAKAPKDDAA
jgi:hypothetical protein